MMTSSSRGGQAKPIVTGMMMSSSEQHYRRRCQCEVVVGERGVRRCQFGKGGGRGEGRGGSRKERERVRAEEGVDYDGGIKTYLKTCPIPRRCNNTHSGDEG